jgi:hypothetical protein
LSRYAPNALSLLRENVRLNCSGKMSAILEV